MCGQRDTEMRHCRAKSAVLIVNGVPSRPRRWALVTRTVQTPETQVVREQSVLAIKSGAMSRRYAHRLFLEPIADD